MTPTLPVKILLLEEIQENNQVSHVESEVEVIILISYMLEGLTWFIGKRLDTKETVHFTGQAIIDVQVNVSKGIINPNGNGQF